MVAQTVVGMNVCLGRLDASGGRIPSGISEPHIFFDHLPTFQRDTSALVKWMVATLLSSAFGGSESSASPRTVCLQNGKSK